GRAHEGLLPLDMRPHVKTEHARRAELVRRFLHRFPRAGFDQRFPLLPMTGRLVVDQTSLRLLLDEQELAVAFHDGGNDDAGIPGGETHGVGDCDISAKRAFYRAQDARTARALRLLGNWPFRDARALRPFIRTKKE